MDGNGKEAKAYFVFNITFDDNAKNEASLSGIEYGDQWLRGDVNMDNEVTIADVTALVNMLLGTAAAPSEEMKKNADANEDGEISVADIKAVVEIILGKGR